MQTIYPQDILAYTQCPRRTLHDNGTVKQKSSRLSVFKSVVKKAYKYQLKYRQYPLWRTVSNWLDKEIKTQVKSKKDYTNYTSLLPIIHKWYHKNFIHESTHLIVDLPIIINLDGRITYYDVIDLVLMDNKIEIVDFGTADKLESINSLTLYNDHLTQLRAWGLYRVFEIEPEKYTRYYMTKTTVEPVSYFLRGKVLETAEKLVQHAAYGMFNGSYYPIRGEQCNTCPYFINCSF